MIAGKPTLSASRPLPLLLSLIADAHAKACTRMRKSGSAVKLAHALFLHAQGSKLQGVEGAMDDWQRVWAPHPEEGYQLHSSLILCKWGRSVQ